jgi:predicted O-linked N-acetylglucosamine transferase (SPINDLY family)
MTGTLPTGAGPQVLQHVLEAAVRAHQLGQLAQAEALYLEALRARPDLFEARHLLGVLRGQQGRYEEALALVGAALKARPDSVGALANYGLILHRMRRHAEALASFEAALALKPDNPEALNNRGNALSALDRPAEALSSYDRVLALRPDYAEAHHNRGLALAALGRDEEAAVSHARAVHVRPDYAEAHEHRGDVLVRLGRTEEALASYERALALQPRRAQLHDSRGNILARLGRYEEALESHDAALAIEPDFAAALNNRGLALERLRRFDEALASFDRAIALRPGSAEAHGNRGNLLLKLRRLDEALAAYDAMIPLEASADAYFNRGNVLSALRRHQDAAASYERALALDPQDSEALAALANTRSALCDWRQSGELARRLADQVREGRASFGPFALLAHGDDPALLLQCARKFVARQVPQTRRSPGGARPPDHQRIRLAYLSADFRAHVMAYQLVELFELHDRQRFELIGISFAGDDGSGIRARLIKSFDRFIDASAKSDREVAGLMRDLEVDIAVDLMGHTLGARIGLFAHRPAAIQVSYLGYAGTTGADFIDYIIGDPVALPADQQPFFTERIVQLPECFFVTDSKRAISSPTPSRRETGLPDRGFVFACFNNPAKLAPATFDLWMRLLKQVDGSVLWLSSGNVTVQDNLRREAQARGVDQNRLVFAQRVPDMADHLARLALADLFLDTLPYNAHATAVDALWAGVPVLTCPGRTFAARVAASLVTAVGLPELVTASVEEYEGLALRLAGDAQLLGGFRRRLGQARGTCALFDTGRFCRHLEAAYATMVERLGRGEAAAGFRVPARLDGPTSDAGMVSERYG